MRYILNRGALKQAAVSGDRLVASMVPVDGAIRRAIVLPRLGAVLSPRPAGHIRGVALVQLADGTVWMLSMSGRVWTPNRLRTAANRLTEVSGAAINQQKVQAQLARDIGVESVRLNCPTLDRVRPAEWGVKTIAASMGIAVSRLMADLEEARQAFVGQLDAGALGLSIENGRTNIAVYNYLAYKPHRHYRQQFAEVFPGLLDMTVTGTVGTFGEELRIIVDNGAPVVKGLAESWGVRPGVVKRLIGRSGSDFGVEWSRDMKTLATLLNVLRPEDLPQDDRDSWRQFNEVVSLGEKIFGGPVHEDAAAMAWLRECVFRTNRGTDRARAIWLPGGEALEHIARFRHSLSAVLSQETVIQDLSLEARKREILGREINSVLSRSAHKGLATLATRFDEELDKLRKEPVQVSAVARADAMWPLIPHEYVSKDKTRVVKPLITKADLTAHGESIVNCLAGVNRESYLRRGRNGTVFVVGILDARTRWPCSTAEIVVNFGRERVGYSLKVRQHTGRQNKKPSARCTRALKELMAHCGTPEISRHIERGWAQIAKRRSLKAREIKEYLGSLPVSAMKQTIGEPEFEQLLQRVRDRLGIGEQ